MRSMRQAEPPVGAMGVDFRSEQGVGRAVDRGGVGRGDHAQRLTLDVCHRLTQRDRNHQPVGGAGRSRNPGGIHRPPEA